MKRTSIGLLVLAAIVLSSPSGCATMMKDVFGNDQLVTFHSEPEGAEVFVNGVRLGVTPLSTPVEARKEGNYMLRLDGYEVAQGRMTTQLDVKFWGNFLSGGLLGSTTDFASDNMWEYSPESYFIQLEPKTVKTSAAWKHRRRVYDYVFMNQERLGSAAARGRDNDETIVSLSKLSGLSPSAVRFATKAYLEHQDGLRFARSFLPKS